MQNPGPLATPWRSACHAPLMHQCNLSEPKSLMRVLAADPKQQIPCRDTLRKLILRLFRSMNMHMQQSQQRHTHLPVHRGASPFAGSRVFQSKSTARNLQSHAQLKCSRTRLVVRAVAEAAQENKASAAEAEPVQQVASFIFLMKQDFDSGRKR